MKSYFFAFAGAWVNCQPITFYCADDNFCQWPWEKREREKWDGKINVSQICSSHTLKTIKSGKEFQEKQLLEFFHYLFTFEYELWITLLLNFILKRSNSEPPGRYLTTTFTDVQRGITVKTIYFQFPRPIRSESILQNFFFFVLFLRR